MYVCMYMCIWLYITKHLSKLRLYKLTEHTALSIADAGLNSKIYISSEQLEFK